MHLLGFRSLNTKNKQSGTTHDHSWNELVAELRGRIEPFFFMLNFVWNFEETRAVLWIQNKILRMVAWLSIELLLIDIIYVLKRNEIFL